jgi:hypothetical protein
MQDATAPPFSLQITNKIRVHSIKCKSMPLSHLPPDAIYSRYSLFIQLSIFKIKLYSRGDTLNNWPLLIFKVKATMKNEHIPEVDGGGGLQRCSNPLSLKFETHKTPYPLNYRAHISYPLFSIYDPLMLHKICLWPYWTPS